MKRIVAILIGWMDRLLTLFSMCIEWIVNLKRFYVPSMLSSKHDRDMNGIMWIWSTAMLNKGFLLFDFQFLFSFEIKAETNIAFWCKDWPHGSLRTAWSEQTALSSLFSSPTNIQSYWNPIVYLVPVKAFNQCDINEALNSTFKTTKWPFLVCE